MSKKTSATHRNKAKLRTVPNLAGIFPYHIAYLPLGYKGYLDNGKEQIQWLSELGKCSGVLHLGVMTYRQTSGHTKARSSQASR